MCPKSHQSSLFHPIHRWLTHLYGFIIPAETWPWIFSTYCSGSDNPGQASFSFLHRLSLYASTAHRLYLCADILPSPILFQHQSSDKNVLTMLRLACYIYILHLWTTLGSIPQAEPCLHILLIYLVITPYLSCLLVWTPIFLSPSN